VNPAVAQLVRSFPYQEALLLATRAMCSAWGGGRGGARRRRRGAGGGGGGGGRGRRRAGAGGGAGGGGAGRGAAGGPGAAGAAGGRAGGGRRRPAGWCGRSLFRQTGTPAYPPSDRRSSMAEPGPIHCHTQLPPPRSVACCAAIALGLAGVGWGACSGPWRSGCRSGLGVLLPRASARCSAGPDLRFC